MLGTGERFRPFIEDRAVDIIHPDPLTSGAIRETKRIADYASMFEIPTAIHFADSPAGRNAMRPPLSRRKFAASEIERGCLPARRRAQVAEKAPLRT